MGGCLSQQTGWEGRGTTVSPAAAAKPDWGCLPEELLVSCLAHLSLEERCALYFQSRGVSSNKLYAPSLQHRRRACLCRQRTAAGVCRSWRRLCTDSRVLLRHVELAIDGCCDRRGAADDAPASWRGCGLGNTCSQLAAVLHTRRRSTHVLRRLRSLRAWLLRAAPHIRHASLRITLPVRLGAVQRLEAAALIVDVLTALGCRSAGSSLQSVTLDLFSGPCHTLHLRAIRPQDGGAPLAPLLGPC